MSQACRHCGTPCADGSEFCCVGCEAVWHALQDDGLQTFYTLRGGAGVPVGEDAMARRSWEPEVTEIGDGTVCATVGVDGVHCAGCVWLVERMPQMVNGVVDARLNLGRGRLEIRWDSQASDFKAIDRWLGRFGYSAYPLDAGRGEEQERREREALVKVGVSWALAANIMLLTVALYGGLDSSDGVLFAGARWLSMLLAGASMAYGGREFFRRAVASFRPFRGLGRLGVDVPVSLGLFAGFIFSAWNTVAGAGDVWFDSVGVLIAALLTARWLHARGLRKAADATNRLAAILPRQARRLLGDGVEEVPTTALEIGDIVEVRTGDVVPADGRVIDGFAGMDRALLTGESRPETANLGDQVWAGETAIRGAVRVEVEATGSETRFGQLVDWVLNAEDHRAATVALADRLAGWFVAAILLGAAATAIWASYFAPGELLPRVIALLVVSCPCALGMATPLAFSIAVGRAARRGIFVRHDGVFETLRDIDTIVLDKTGTITAGAMRIDHVDGDRDALPYAAAAERLSAHPVAKAFVAHDRGLRVEDFDEVIGSGVCAMVDGKRVEVRAADTSEAATTIEIVVDGVRRATVTLADTIRFEARELIADWQHAGIEVWVASGDHDNVVRHVAELAGVPLERALSRQTPETNFELVRRLQEQGRRVAMVGDGVNDAAALREADTGIAMFGGAGINAIAADVQLGRSGLAPIAELRSIADDALGTVHRNLALSAVYNVLALTAAAAGLVSPLVAAIAMPISSIAVVVSSLSQGARRPAREPSSSVEPRAAVVAGGTP